ncbi:uncharacterized protein LOC100900370 [Galendromus occidentalis]|uniref:Uncharacterized protein LOC100900370 n=1 Tax=Galendromus occidentalis TaxID=34638 RepID=A0AAJ6QLS6_9ACAR|nr:uncharacterized protein LOC100900370 [Galendromus occidentalis]
MLLAVLFVIGTILRTECFLFGTRSNARQRNVVYYVCLNYEAVDSTQASECVYCPQRQTVACTGISGPPLQVTRTQATCLTTYCSSGVLGQNALNGNAVPVSQRRRRDAEPAGSITALQDIESTVLLNDSES